MSLLDKFKFKTNEIAQNTVVKSKQVAEVTKINLSIASEENNINKLYVKLGKYYYEHDERFDDPVPNLYCEEINVRNQKIQNLKKQIAAARQDEDIFKDEAYDPSKIILTTTVNSEKETVQEEIKIPPNLEILENISLNNEENLNSNSEESM